MIILKFFQFIFILGIIFLFVFLISNQNYIVYDNDFKRELLAYQKKEIYDICMTIPYVGKDTLEKLSLLKNESLNQNLSFSYYDIDNKFSFSCTGEKVYYGASIIKLLEANYLFREALNGNLDLSQTLTYSLKHKKPFSLKMQDYHVGDKVSILDLISYAISVSDNTAHEMLYDFIGLNNLKQYALHLGITLSINSLEHYGNLTSDDGLKILQDTYSIMTEKKEYFDILSKFMDNDYYNSLNFGEQRFYHKYGITDSFYHDIGISARYPYLISIFTMQAYHDYQGIVSDMSKKIYQIYKENLIEKRLYCSNV